VVQGCALLELSFETGAGLRTRITEMITIDAECPDSSESITQLLVAAQAGEQAAWETIYGLVYRDLYRIARGQLRRRKEGRMSATSLISESWLRLSGAEFSVESRRHFTALVARAMRFVLIDEARKEMTEKYGEGRRVLPLHENIDAAQDGELLEMIALDDALTRLSNLEPRLARLVEMRYFGGLDEAEIAHALGVTERTLRRDWRRARAFLLAQLGEPIAYLESNV
jgi:RNA polymerase sigma factor (TIGR02999 family)